MASHRNRYSNLNYTILLSFVEPGFFQITLKVMLIKGNQFLILRDAIAQTGDLPGGRLAQTEFYQSWVDALRRELHEELGPDVQYTLHEEPLFHFPHRILSAQTDALGIVYRATYRGGNLQISDEHDDFAWVSLDTYDPTGFFSASMAAAIRRFQALTS